MSTSEYTLANPLIEGSLNKTFKAKTPDDAAASAWQSLSSVFVGDVPRFGFTLMNGAGKLFHYYVTEVTGKGTKTTNFNIKPLNLKLSKKHEKEFVSAAAKRAQTGGKKDRHKDVSSDDDDSDSDSDSELYKKIKMFKNSNIVDPIQSWWYSPLIYTLQDTVLFDTINIPTFVVPMRPRIEIDMSVGVPLIYSYKPSVTFGW